MTIGIIGAGFFGVYLALEFAEQGHQVTLFENESDIMNRASLNNQARVHNGYHYPRSFLTASRSRKNSHQFIERYKNSICDQFTHVYAIAKNFSHTNALQFQSFCKIIDAPLKPASVKTKKLFSPHLVEDVFTVQEPSFDAIKLKKFLFDDLTKARVKLFLNTSIERVETSKNNHICVHAIESSQSREYEFDRVIGATYSTTNQLLRNSNLPLIPLAHEWAELVVVTLPSELSALAITIMDGPFWSCTPFPAAKNHILSHVRYTPHFSWQIRSVNDQEIAHRTLSKNSAFSKMIKDASRFVPLMAEARFEKSLWEIKTTMPRSNSNDSRPILFKMNHGIDHLSFVLGAKIDNVFELTQEIKGLTC